MAYKLKKREISPIAAPNSNKMQTSSNFHQKVSEIQKSTQYKKTTLSPDSHKNDLIMSKISGLKNEKGLDLKKVLLENKMTKSIKGLPIKFFNEAIKGKTIPSNPNSDRTYGTKTNFNKKNCF